VVVELLTLGRGVAEQGVIWHEAFS
jgi:hypothetical protein